MTLLSASKITSSPEIRDRVEAAIRKVATSKITDSVTGPELALAKAGYTAPETVANGFMLRVATNGDVVNSACDACGHVSQSAVPDATVEWIVANGWPDVAKDLYPDT